MSINIIVRSKRSQREHTIVERAKSILARYYKTECEHPEKFKANELPGKPSKKEILQAWSDDARGDVDPNL